MKALVSCLLLTVSAAGQDSTKPQFEVAAVKLVAAGPSGVKAEHGVLTINSFGMRALLAWAYDLPSFAVEVPEWSNSLRFDVAAKAPSPVPLAELRRMLQTLLDQRFKLALHHETREFELMLMTAGKAAAKLKPSDSDLPREFHSDRTTGHLVFQHTTMGELAAVLTGTGAYTLDQTGLAGRYDFVVNYGKFLDPADAGDPRAVFTAWRDAVSGDLGLSLKLGKAKVDVLVIDHLEKAPSEK